MKKLLVTILILTAFSPAFSQKLSEPKFLGSYIAGEDPSEFLIHKVIEYSHYLLKENPEGKLIVRICSQDGFSTAFVKAPLNPLWVSSYSQKYFPVLYERTYIVRSSTCNPKGGFISLQYWFVPDKITVEKEEIFPATRIFNQIIIVDEYDWKNPSPKKLIELNQQFAENIEKFVNNLKTNSKTEGFIVYNSNKKRMKQNIEKVKEILKKENIALERVKMVRRMLLELNAKEKLVPVTDDGFSYPRLVTLTISEENTANKN